MTFTRRTYRVAIRRSIREEALLRKVFKERRGGRNAANLIDQIAHTARLQRRKRRERK